jgi:hypothetical protein
MHSQVVVLGGMPLYATDTGVTDPLDSLRTLLNQFAAESAVSGMLSVEVTVSTDDDDDKQT